MNYMKQNDRFVLQQRRCYANFYFKEEDHVVFTNDHYIFLLRMIGKYCYGTECVRAVCKFLKNDYNKYYHYNRLRHRKRRMTINQIESLTRSFWVRGDCDSIRVRIPFTTVPILFFILQKYLTIEDNYPHAREELKRRTIGEHYCSYQIDIMKAHLNKLLESTSDDEYKQRCNALNDEIVNKRAFVDMGWVEFVRCDKDYVIEHWKKAV